MQANCRTTETIVIPDGVTLEGANKTIHMSGPLSGYQFVAPAGINLRPGLLIQDGVGSIKNVKIDQDAVECDGPTSSAIVMANGRGDIEAVEIVVTKNNRNCYRGGINAQPATDNDLVNIRNVTITGTRFSGIAINGPAATSGPVRGEIRGCTISGPSFGMVLTDTAANFHSTDNNVTAGIGITVASPPAQVFIDDNVITGLSGQTNLFGINFDSEADGTVNNNTISGFGCGIAIQTGAGEVTESNNTFSGNTTNVCDPHT